MAEAETVNVPREPTMEMGLAGAEQVNRHMRGPGPGADYDAAKDAYRAMLSAAPKAAVAEAETKSVADVPDARWFYSCSDDLWYGECATKEEAIAEGREGRSDGEPFQVAQGRFCGPFADLFDAEHLTDLIDESHEDRTWEEAFTEEAGLSRDDIVALAGDLNAVWKAFCDKHKPVSRRLNLWGYEDVPGTPEWQAREAEQDAACAAIARAEEAQ